MMPDNDSNPGRYRSVRNRLSWLVNRLSSMRFALALLFILGFFILLEALLPISIVRESYLFAFLCLALVLSLVLCNSRRLTATLRRFLWGIPATSVDSIPSSSLLVAAVANQSPDATLDSTVKILKGQRFRVFRRDSRLLYADRGWVGFPGSLLLHLGIILIVTGMSFGTLAGFEGTVYLTAGQSFREDEVSYDNLREGWKNIFLGSHRGFETRLDHFEVTHGDNPNPEGFTSRVTILDDGDEVLTSDIRVNEPLSYQGVRIYQSTYGWAPKVRIEEPSGSKLMDDILYCPVSDSGTGITSFGFPDLHISMDFIVVPDRGENGGMVSRSPLPNNPVLFFVLRSEDTIMAIEDVPLGSSGDVSGLLISFDELERYSGLQVTSSPEIPVIYSGFGIVVIGLVLVFYVTPRWLWVIAEPQEGRTRVLIRWASGRRGYTSDNDIARLAEVIEKSL